MHQFKKKVLKNGITLLFEKREMPLASIGVGVKFGGMHEHESEKGISHFIEHMLFKGTKQRSAEDISKEVERNGGILNAFTSESSTVYFSKISSDKVNVVLEVFFDILKNSVFEDSEVIKERKVIFEEIKMRKDDPSLYASDKICSMLYKKPFSLPTIGTNKTMNSISRLKLLSKFKEVYQPKNMVFCFVGNIDFEKISKIVERNFEKKRGKIPKFKISIANKSETEKRKGIDQANVIFAVHSPLYKDKRSHASLLLNTLMAGGMSSRLFAEIREKRNLAYMVSGESNVNKDFSYSVIKIGTKKENVGIVKELILDEFQKVHESLDEKELRQVKEQMIGHQKILSEDSLNQMNTLIQHEIEGQAEDFYQFEKNIKNVKLKEVRDLAKIKKYSFFALVPNN